MSTNSIVPDLSLIDTAFLEHRSSVDAKSSKLGQVKIEEAEVHRHQEKHADSQHEQESEKHKIAAQHLHHAQEEHAEAERKEEKQRKKIAGKFFVFTFL